MALIRAFDRAPSFGSKLNELNAKPVDDPADLWQCFVRSLVIFDHLLGSNDRRAIQLLREARQTFRMVRDEDGIAIFEPRRKSDSRRKPGRPKGLSSIDETQAVLVAAAKDRLGMSKADVIRLCGRYTDSDGYKWLERRLKVGRSSVRSWPGTTLGTMDRKWRFYWVHGAAHFDQMTASQRRRYRLQLLAELEKRR
jgi:hypothetical protein